MLAESLPLESVEPWLQEHQLESDPPVDLTLVKPDSRLMLEVLTRQRTVASLADEEALQLHYDAPGKQGGLGLGEGVALLCSSCQRP